MENWGDVVNGRSLNEFLDNCSKNSIYSVTLTFFSFDFRYLHEIGYTDTIIDVRSNRVRSLLGLHDVPESSKDENCALNGGGEVLNATTTRRPDNSNAGGNTVGGGQPGSNRRATVGNTLAEERLVDMEAAVMANFDFLSSEVGLNSSRKNL